ncbi:MAG: nucleotidyltransferase family protein [Clostridiales Family XIII bacterium]|nr:nucleotidyltransferase family protein [Clostridiales Family XIII bacterium]
MSEGGLDAAAGLLGIVAEYNPFHYGHRFHIARSVELTGAHGVVAVMSGDFVQRGEPALIDKWRRARTAVKHGVDLVLELPFLYATGSAECFASGAVRLLDALPGVTHLAFGCEEGAVEPLAAAARVLAAESPAFKEALRAGLKAGRSFPRARAAALRREAGDAAARLLDYPNNILAVEYLKQCIRMDSRLVPVAVPRVGAGCFEADPRVRIAGAAAIRRLFLTGRREEALRYLPEWEGDPAVQSPDMYFTLTAAVARLRSKEELRAIVSASEGLENRLLRALDGAFDMPSLIAAIKTARYTETRIRRFLLHTLFGVTRERFAALDAAWPCYLRVLALSERGGGILRRIKAHTDIPVVTKPSGPAAASPAAGLLALDVLAADLYNLIGGAGPAASDYRMHPFVCARDSSAVPQGSEP